jgi:ribonuclease HI
MISIGMEAGISTEASPPSEEMMRQMPAWLNINTQNNKKAKKLYRSKKGRCLRIKHSVNTIDDLMRTIESMPPHHKDKKLKKCTCQRCKTRKQQTKCEHPHKCEQTAIEILETLYPNWNPLQNAVNPTLTTPETPQNDPNETVFDPGNNVRDLKTSIRIFVNENERIKIRPQKAPPSINVPENNTTIYTDGSCINQGTDNARAGSGIWLGTNRNENIGLRVPGKEQSNQIAELYAILQAIKNSDPNTPL